MQYTKVQLDTALGRMKKQFDAQSQERWDAYQKEIKRKSDFLMALFTALEEDFKAHPSENRVSLLSFGIEKDEDGTDYFRYNVAAHETFACEIEIHADGYWHHDSLIPNADHLEWGKDPETWLKDSALDDMGILKTIMWALNSMSPDSVMESRARIEKKMGLSGGSACKIDAQPNTLARQKEQDLTFWNGFETVFRKHPHPALMIA